MNVYHWSMTRGCTRLTVGDTACVSPRTEWNTAAHATSQPAVRETLRCCDNNSVYSEMYRSVKTAVHVASPGSPMDVTLFSLWLAAWRDPW